MTKDIFLSKLKEKLRNLNQEEVNDIISEFEEHIDAAIADGKSEEDVIRAFGDVDELAKEILATYKISANNTDFKDNLEVVIAKIVDTTQEVVEGTVKLTKEVIGEAKVKINEYENTKSVNYDSFLSLLIKLLIVTGAIILLLGVGRFVFYPIPFLHWILDPFVWIANSIFYILCISLLVIFIIKIVDKNKVNNRPEIKTIIENKTNLQSNNCADELNSNTEGNHSFVNENGNEKINQYNQRNTRRNNNNDVLRIALIVILVIMLSPFIIGLIGISIGAIFAAIPTLIALIITIISAINFDSAILAYIAIIIGGLLFLEASFINLFFDFIKSLTTNRKRGDR